MGAREAKEGRERKIRQALCYAHLMAEDGAWSHAMVYAMLAVMRMAPWVDLDRVKMAIHDMTDHGDA